MKVIITGATGMVGKGVLLECLEQADVTEILSISRRSTGITHRKLKELIHEDFSDFEAVKDQLVGYDACYACMGVSAAGMNEEQYRRVTYDFTMALASVLVQLNQQMTFIYVSGQGTDATETARSMWARVKGKTEKDLMQLGFRQAFMFRPGMIIPVKGVSPSSKLYRVLINNLTWLIKLIKWMAPTSVVNSAQIGQAMIRATMFGYDKHIITPRDIIELSGTPEKD